MRTGDASIYSDYILKKEPRDRKEHNDHKDGMDSNEYKEHNDHKDGMDSNEYKDSRDHKGRRDHSRRDIPGTGGARIINGDNEDHAGRGDRGTREENKDNAGGCRENKTSVVLEDYLERRGRGNSEDLESSGESLERRVWVRDKSDTGRRDHKGVGRENEGQEQADWEIGGKRGITRVRGFKRSLAVFTLIVIVTVVAPLFYTYVVPRSELTVTTVYHETTGTGSVGYITVALKVSNTGTIPVEDVNVTLHVINGSMDLKGWSNRTFGRIGPRQYRTLDLSFAGSHYKDYMISVSVRATIGSEVRGKRMSHDVIDDKQPYMNIEWTDSV